MLEERPVAAKKERAGPEGVHVTLSEQQRREFCPSTDPRSS